MIHNMSKISTISKHKFHPEAFHKAKLFVCFQPVSHEQEGIHNVCVAAVFSIGALDAFLLPLTWLPSFCQKMAGGGFPVVLHWKVTLLPWEAI